jgi:hypothetical protein
MRFHFTIRDLLWLTALVALAVGWWLDHRTQHNRYQVLINDQPKIVGYQIRNADPESVVNTLKTILAGAPDVRLAADTKAKNVVAIAHDSQHAVIRALIIKLDVSPVTSNP